MTIQRITQDEIEFFDLETHPSRTYISSSVDGTDGNIHLFSRRSSIEKQTQQTSPFLNSDYKEDNLDILLKNARINALSGSNNQNYIEQYLGAINSLPTSSRKFQTLDIVRFQPGFEFNSNTIRKNLITDTLMPFYRNVYPTSHFAYTNYHALNFFTASSVPSNAALLYPNEIRSTSPNGIYSVSSSFTFDFWVNPKYSTESDTEEFKAGTILHLSSSFAVSLISGSAKDVNGCVNGYRLLLQLSQSAEMSPNLASVGTFTYMSEDNSLKRNNWHHVTIRWSKDVNHSSGSFIIDERSKGDFYVPATSIFPSALDAPGILSVGNFYSGENTGVNSQVLFFSKQPSTREGLVELDSTPSVEGPSVYSFSNPLNAEIHELKIYNTYLSNDQVTALGSNGPSDLNNLIFYVPPFFREDSPYKIADFSLNQGGILMTPFYAYDGSTSEPYNVDYSFGVGGHVLNLDNFLFDYASKVFPRTLNLMSSMIPGSTPTPLSANDFLYASDSNRFRNLLLLPCDNGLFYPNYQILENDYLTYNSASILTNGLGLDDISWISLEKMLPVSSVNLAVNQDEGTILSGTVASTPDDLRHINTNSDVLTIYQRTRDASSNEIVIFDISNLYYGNTIYPTSFEATDANVTGSSGKVSITIKDDGYGNLYRADCETQQATWNSVGNIFYNEGLVLIKTPNIPMFGKDQFSISFKGTQTIHTIKLNTLARSKQLTESSNPTYIPGLSASTSANQTNDNFVYINGIYFHDENLNVVIKNKFSGPIVKRYGEKYMFSTKLDY